MNRVYGLGRSQEHSYPSYAPKVIWHRVTHRLFGPLLGCSCSGPLRQPGGCFMSKWRIDYPARDGYRDTVRLGRLEERVRELERARARARAQDTHDEFQRHAEERL